MLSSATTEPRPSDTVERTCFRPSTPSICSSILRMIDSSISSGVAPGYATETSTRSIETCGNTSCTRPRSAKSPAIRMNSIRRLAATPFRAM